MDRTHSFYSKSSGGSAFPVYKGSRRFRGGELTGCKGGAMKAFPANASSSFNMPSFLSRLKLSKRKKAPKRRQRKVKRKKAAKRKKGSKRKRKRKV